MSKNINEIFSRLQGYQSQQRELKKMYRDALSVNGEYQEAIQELEALKLKKKKIEMMVQADFKEEWDKLEGLKLNIAGDKQMLSDLALLQLTQGEEVKVIDQNQVTYEPIFSVRFKKAN